MKISVLLQKKVTRLKPMFSRNSHLKCHEQIHLKDKSLVAAAVFGTTLTKMTKPDTAMPINLKNSSIVV